MSQGTDPNFTEYVGKISYDVLHVIDFPPGLDNIFMNITDMFTAISGPFAIIASEGKDTTEFYAGCFNDVRMAKCATWYNLCTFEDLCRELEARVEEVTKTLAIDSQLNMIIGGSAQKLCFEYEHFMFHQKMTADRIAFYLSSFFKQKHRNIFTLRESVKQFLERPDHPKHRYALAIDAVVSKHQSFLSPIHSSESGRGQTERDILSHQYFIPFASPYVQITPPGKVSVVFQAAVNRRTVAPESAKAILHERYNHIAEFTKDMLDAFFNA
jgi:hypothetical protein